MVVLAVGAGADLRAEDGKAKAEAGICGVWRAQSLEQGGMKLPESAVRYLVFEINEKTILMRRRGEKVAETAYTLDATKQPAAIDLTYDGQPCQGIYERSGDRLKICLSEADEARPKRFVVGDEGGQMLLAFVNTEVDKRPLSIMGADGTNLRTLVAHPEFTTVGSPAWSPDGKRIAFDAWRSVQGETYGQAHVLVANADGSDVKDLGDGAMPSWSPDGKRIVLSRYEPNRGVWIMNADGTNLKLIDAEGWGIDWCPKDNRVAYTKYDLGANIIVHDLDKDERRTLFTRAYQAVYWGLIWSPDGEWIAFKGVNGEGQTELAAINTAGEAKGFKSLLPKAMPGVKNILTAVGWGGDGKRLMASLVGPDGGSYQLYSLDFAEQAPAQLVPGQDPQRAYTDMAMSPDGKKILVVIARPKPK